MAEEIRLRDRNLALEAVRVTERAAIASAAWMGRGDEKAADQAAVDAMRQALNVLDIDGTVVIGEGERDEAPMLYIGERVGSGNGPKVDIALDPLEGTTITATGGPNAIACLAMAGEGGFLNAPDTYMDKIAVGGGLPEGVIDIDAAPAREPGQASPRPRSVEVGDLVVLILDRPRHQELIAKVREAGARIRLIRDGDVAGVIATARPDSGIDIYIGIGGAPEGVLAAAALRSIGGQMQGRLHVPQRRRAGARRAAWGSPISTGSTTCTTSPRGDVMFAATGVTDGTMLRGVRRFPGGVITHSIVMRSKTGTVRVIETEHYLQRKAEVVPEFVSLSAPAAMPGAGRRALGQRPLLALARARRRARARDLPAPRRCRRWSAASWPARGVAARRRAGVHRAAAARRPARPVASARPRPRGRAPGRCGGRRRAGRPARRLRRRRRHLGWRCSRAICRRSAAASRSTCPTACAKATAPTRRRSSASPRRAAGWW